MTRKARRHRRICTDTRANCDRAARLAPLNAVLAADRFALVAGGEIDHLSGASLSVNGRRHCLSHWIHQRRAAELKVDTVVNLPRYRDLTLGEV